MALIYESKRITLIDPILVRNAMRFTKLINIFCGDSDWHHMVGCITKLQIPPTKSYNVAYRSLKYFDENTFIYFKLNLEVEPAIN